MHYKLGQLNQLGTLPVTYQLLTSNLAGPPLPFFYTRNLVGTSPPVQFPVRKHYLKNAQKCLTLEELSGADFSILQNQKLLLPLSVNSNKIRKKGKVRDTTQQLKQSVLLQARREIQRNTRGMRDTPREKAKP